MDLGEKVVWIVVIAGMATALIYAVIKLGEVVVRRRTEALLAAHAEDDGEGKDEEQAPQA